MGISACLLGRAVRYDGGHKQDDLIISTLGRTFCWVSVCPEVEVGMGVPREPVQLIERPSGSRMVGVRSGRDWTVAMAEFAARRVEELARVGLHGYILKKDSPSCGLRVPLHRRGSGSEGTGRGLFADVLVTRLPALPVEEEDRLSDPGRRRAFVEEVLGYYRMQIRRPDSAGA